MHIEETFDILTGKTDSAFGKVRGTTKKEVRHLCGDDWDERAWKRMVNFSNKAKSKIVNAPFYDKEERLWFWI